MNPASEEDGDGCRQWNFSWLAGAYHRDLERVSANVTVQYKKARDKMPVCNKCSICVIKSKTSRVNSNKLNYLHIFSILLCSQVLNVTAELPFLVLWLSLHLPHCVHRQTHFLYCTLKFSYVIFFVHFLLKASF